MVNLVHMSTRDRTQAAALQSIPASTAVTGIRLTAETSTDQMVGDYPMVVGDDGLYRNLHYFKELI
jgi:hypothetical protein